MKKSMAYLEELFHGPGNRRTQREDGVRYGTLAKCTILSVLFWSYLRYPKTKSVFVQIK